MELARIADEYGLLEGTRAPPAEDNRSRVDDWVTQNWRRAEEPGVGLELREGGPVDPAAPRGATLGLPMNVCVQTALPAAEVLEPDSTPSAPVVVSRHLPEEGPTNGDPF